MAERRNLTATREDYLRAIWTLRESSEAEGRRVRAVDLAKNLGLAKSTVSERLVELVERKWVQARADGGLDLSARGRAIASRLTLRHRIIEVFLSRTLAMADDHLHAEAHKLEHGFSDEVLERLVNFLGRPATCPHGRPIPYPAGD